MATAPNTTTAPTTTPPDESTTSAPGGDAATGRLVEIGDTVSVHYIGTLDDGEIFDSSREREQTLDFVVGAGQMISGFDAAVRGMSVGEVKTVRLEPAEAYGERSDELIREVPLEQVPEGTQAGDELFTTDGRTVVVVEVVADDGVVLIDFNHRLAGQALTFEIEMVSIG